MSNPLVYIDQNIIGLHLQGLMNLCRREDLIWTYSKEHFAEIRRSNEPEQYLELLKKINAKMLDLNLDENWKITGEAKLVEHGAPYQHYENYIETTGSVEFDNAIFDPLQVWINGGGDEESLKMIPDNFAQQILQLTSYLPFDTKEMTEKVESIKPRLDSVIGKLISAGNNIKKTRAAFGNEKGTIGSISDKQQIKKIWEIISPTMSGVDISCDQFFGFDPIEKQGYESWPVYLGIIACNSVMDTLGYQAEKKCRKISKIHNVRSDAAHIAMGAYCTTILSADKRLIERAEAIYEYKNISTLPILVGQKTSKSIKPTANASAN